MKQLRAIVEGRVQGVGFREFVRRNASILKLKGCVRNLDDDSVEVIAEGEDVALDHLLVLLEKGPSLSRVDEVQVSYHPPSGAFDDFTVCY